MGVVVLALALQDWSPLRGFDQAAHDFFAVSTAESLGARLDVWDVDAQGFDLDLAVFPKIGFARGRAPYRGDVTDLALAAVAVVPLDFADLRVQVGASWPAVPDVILARERDVRAQSFGFAGAGLEWEIADGLRFGVELELNGAAFRDVDLLQRHPASGVAGLHAVWGRARLDAGVGLGADRVEGWPWMAFLGLTISF
jgi:hypothetical protein